MPNILSVVAERSLAEPADPAARVAAAFLVRHQTATRGTYVQSLRAWATWCQGHDLGLLDVRRAHVERWLRELELQRVAPATRARHLAALAGFYATAVDEDAIARSPVDRVRRPRVSGDSPQLGLDRDQARAFLAAAEAAGVRDHALACLLTLNGLRVSEAVALDASDVAMVRGHRTVGVLRKGGSRRDVPLAPRTAAALDALLAQRSAGALFVDGVGNRLDRQDAWRAVRRLARRADIAQRTSPHSLRHTFVTLSLDAGVPLRDVQDAAGHADPRTTRRYDRGRHSLDRHATYALASFLG